VGQARAVTPQPGQHPWTWMDLPHPLIVIFLFLMCVMGWALLSEKKKR
jgi:hypothetical protein